MNGKASEPGPRTRAAAAARWAGLAVLAAGAALRLVQYLGRASYWLDELPLARMLERFSLARLVTQPLKFQQSTPPAFLAIEKLMQTAFGAGEYSLRFVPLAASLGTLVVVRRILRRLPLSDWSVAAGCALVALSPGLIFYGAELRQYSTDVFCAAGLGLLAIEDLRRKRPGAALFAAAAAAPWLSNQSVFVVCGIAAVFAADAARRGFRGSGRTIAFAVSALASAGAAVLAARAVIPPRTMAYFREFWIVGFPPVPFGLHDFRLWFVGAFAGFWSRFLQFPLPALGLGLVLAGAASRLRAPGPLAILLVPAAAALAAAFPRLYPLEDRSMAFLAPAAIVLSAASLDLLVFSRRAAGDAAAAIGFALAVALGTAALSLHHPFADRQATRDLLRELARLRQPGDAIFVDGNARQAVGFYGPRVGLSLEGITPGPCHGFDVPTFENALAPLQGRSRVWLVVSELVPNPWLDRVLDDYLPGRGRRLYSVAGTPRQPNTRILLLDLSGGPPALRPRPPFRTAVRPNSCLGGPQVPDPEFTP